LDQSIWQSRGKQIVDDDQRRSRIGQVSVSYQWRCSTLRAHKGE